ncbi:MAG: FYDLN acid domain-containing protein [Deltaproteobacteria bacterium]|nr:FYDLN acid domain-containing protein [Deltaproteobacteria bacterium]
MATAAKKSQYGTKYVCYKCECRFYDLNKPTPLCPKCGADQRQAPKVAEPPKPPKASKRAPVVTEIAEDVPVEDTDGMDFDEDEIPTGGASKRETEEEEEEEDEG